MTIYGDKSCETCLWAREKDNYDMECLHPTAGCKVVEPPDGCARYTPCWDKDTEAAENGE